MNKTEAWGAARNCDGATPQATTRKLEYTFENNKLSRLMIQLGFTRKTKSRSGKSVSF